MFSYPNNPHPTLKNISTRFEAGKKIAIVGDNGAGKSSLAKCIIGLYKLQHGRILYDGHNILEINPIDLRKHIAVIFQDFVRYNLTIRENIGFGNLDKMDDDAALQLAVTNSEITTIVQNLEKGMDTELGNQFTVGKDLSGGEWQKVALGRAFMRNADLYVLDEPTSALDPVTESEIFDRFMELTEGKTAIFITHRLWSCRNADKIIVLKEGTIVEEGTHEELLMLKGEYSKMFEVQAKWYSSKQLI